MVKRGAIVVREATLAWAVRLATAATKVAMKAEPKVAARVGGPAEAPKVAARVGRPAEAAMMAAMKAARQEEAMAASAVAARQEEATAASAVVAAAWVVEAMEEVAMEEVRAAVGRVVAVGTGVEPMAASKRTRGRSRRILRCSGCHRCSRGVSILCLHLA